MFIYLIYVGRVLPVHNQLLDGYTRPHLHSTRPKDGWTGSWMRQCRHCTVTYKKCQQRLYCLRKLRSFNVDNTILSMFYKSCIQSVLTFSFICWFGNVSQKDKNSLQRIVNISSKVTGVTQSTLTALYEKQVVNKATRILADDKHVLYADYILLPSSRRFRTVTCKTNRKRFSFVPMSIRLLNDKSLGHYF